jgi:hypothetical protein
MDLFKLFRRKSKDTSIAAAVSIAPEIPNIEAQVYAYARSRGNNGFTDEELNEHFKTTKSSYRSRRADLVEQGLIADTGVRTKNAGGRFTIVWRAL